ncbi:AAA-like domain-containing protein [Desulfobacterales bacterium HSG16]|nr:AAA-like domain-containing protein [Desulfobacterales bacterium HSG16]
MRKFSSYGPVDNKLHYHAPRADLIDRAYNHLTGGANPDKGGHYITVWGPRQTGKTWIMQQVTRKIEQIGDFEACIVSMQSAKNETTDMGVLDVFVKKLRQWFDKDFPDIDRWTKIAGLFGKRYFEKPLILIIDEFDALNENCINKFATEFRDIYISRQNLANRQTEKNECMMLHGLGLIGIRSVLGIENITGSPFNVQRSLNLPNLIFSEVEKLFAWYEKERGQKIEPDVINRLFCETRGQPGLTCWFGELLTETFNKDKDIPVTMTHFEGMFKMAVNALPNNNILNIISKAKQKPYRNAVLDLFKTDQKTEFAFDDSILNFLFTNGVIDTEKVKDNLYVKFSSPFVQKRLFNYFSRELFGYVGKIVEPFENLEDTITKEYLNIPNLMKRYQKYLKTNRDWLLKDAPRRKDMRIFEAVYHFNLYMYLHHFLGIKKAKVFPEFPTGNGQVDLIIRYAGSLYAIELKSYTDETGYHEALDQAARYGKQLGLKEIALVFFVEYIDEANREKYEKNYMCKKNGVMVIPIFVDTGIDPLS